MIHNSKIANNIILGSSNTMMDVKAEHLTKWTGKTWFNLSQGGAPIAVQSVVLDVIKERNLNISNIILDCSIYTDNGLKNKPIDSFKYDYQWLAFINCYNSIDNYFKKSKMYFGWKYLPILKYIYYNTELLYPTLALFIKPDLKYNFNNYGDVYYKKEHKPLFEFKEKPRFLTLDYKNGDLLKVIYQSRVNNWNLIGLITPVYQSQTLNKFDFRNWNFSELIQDQRCFYDDVHLNDTGSIIFTKKLAEKINNESI